MVEPGVPTGWLALRSTAGKLSPRPARPSPVLRSLSPVSRPLSPVSSDAPRSVLTRRARKSSSPIQSHAKWEGPHPCGPWRVGLLPDRNPRSPIRSHAKAAKGTKVPDPNPVSRRAAELAEISSPSAVTRPLASLLPPPCFCGHPACPLSPVTRHLSSPLPASAAASACPPSPVPCPLSPPTLPDPFPREAREEREGPDPNPVSRRVGGHIPAGRGGSGSCPTAIPDLQSVLTRRP